MGEQQTVNECASEKVQELILALPLVSPSFTHNDAVKVLALTPYQQDGGNGKKSTEVENALAAIEPKDERYKEGGSPHLPTVTTATTKTAVETKNPAIII